MSGDNGQFHLMCALQHLLGEVEAGEPTPSGRDVTVQKYLGHTLLAGIVNQGLSSVPTVNSFGGDLQVFREAEVAFNGWVVLCGQGLGLLLRIDIYRHASSTQMICDTSSPAQQHRGRWVRCDIDQDLLRM